MPEKVYLENEYLKIAILEKGAELYSLFSKNDALEYLWQADQQYWGRHAPVLFPIVGRLKNGSYQHQGQAYSLAQHGFARDSFFQLLHANSHSACYILNSEAQTEKMYPFHFMLSIEYLLREKALEVSYTVQNSGNSDMYFSIGAHPAFNCPLKAGESFDDYAIYFETEEQAARYHIEDGLQNGAISPLLNGTKELILSYNLFKEDAVIFKNLRSQSMLLLNRKTKKGLEVKFPSFPFLGIWSKPGAPFICIEPWHGITDSQDASGELSTKEGILLLQAKQTFNCVYTIRIV